MSPQTWQRVKFIYAAALELPTNGRADYVRQHAADEPKVLSEALRLLEHQADGPGAMLDALQVPAGLLTNAKRGSLLPGQRLTERYEIRRFIALGGFGEVYEADDMERGERVAIKLFRPEFATADHVAWLRREVQMARRVQHPNVCRVYDFVPGERSAFLTMELLEGETLAAFLRREGALTERRALPLIRQVVAALAAAHASDVIHRDLKPGNIMLVPRPDGPLRVVVTDFGLARQATLDRRTTVSMQSLTAGFGTPAYMAPEQISGVPPGPAADIYSLGVVLHEMLTGELPFASDSPLALAVRKTREVPAAPTQLAPGLRQSWERCILRCLQPNPKDRFGGVREILTFLESRSTAAVTWKLARRSVRRHARTRNFILAAAVAILAIFAWQTWPPTPSPTDLKQWERGIFSLHAGEPMLAIQSWEASPEKVARVHADLALAWQQLKLPGRARQNLAAASSIFAAQPDRLYRQAVEAFLNGDGAGAEKLLKARADAEPVNGLLLADLAYMESLRQHKPSPRWADVVKLRPDHAGAHVQLAGLRADDGDEPGAERAFLAAETYFQAHGQPELVRAVASRRGLFRLASGHAEAARSDLSSFTSQSIPDTGSGPCEHKILLQAGVKDDFAQPPDPVPFISPRFKLMPVIANRLAPGMFDQRPRDTALAVSFPLPPVRICSGQLHLSMRRDPEFAGAENDMIVIGAAPFDANNVPGVQRSLWAGTRDNVNKTDLNVEITPAAFAGAQRAYAGQPQAFLDIFASDDTDFDFITLLIVY